MEQSAGRESRRILCKEVLHAKKSIKNTPRKIGRVTPEFYELLAGRIVRMLK